MPNSEHGDVWRIRTVFDMQPRQVSQLPPQSKEACRVNKATEINDGPKRFQCACGNTPAKDGFCRKCRPETRMKPKKAKAKKRKKKTPSSSSGQYWKKLSKQERKNLFAPYSLRNTVISELGFKSYTSYLKSSKWKNIRAKVLSKENRCCCCGSKAGQVHHSEYTKDNLSGVSLKGLHPVCCECHEKSEFRPNGSKATLEECNVALGIMNPVNCA